MYPTGISFCYATAVSGVDYYYTDMYMHQYIVMSISFLELVTGIDYGKSMSMNYLIMLQLFANSRFYVFLLLLSFIVLLKSKFFC